MNLCHGQLWQRLGLAVLSGILVASLAPATAAAPTGGQDMHGDMESADPDTSSSNSDISSPANALSPAAAEETETADDATASSEEESEGGVDAQVYTFPGTDGPTRIHVLTTTGSADAILLESRGVFAMIDGAEGVGAPDGKDPRYPLRSGVVPGWAGDTDWVLGYMSKHGVTSSNLAFYLGTHAHSDHIDNADDIIKQFRPKVILSPEYSDEWITDKSRLWDNQWTYDNMMAAARWAQGAYGASIVQNINAYNTHITLGDMDVQIIPTDPAENYKKTGVRDANLIAYTAKVSAFGHSAYLAADLEAGGGYEDRIAPIVGRVDMLKAGHHGLPSSNTESFLSALSPSVIVQTGPEWYSPDRLTASVVDGTTVWAPMNQLWSSGHIPSLIATFAPSGISYNDISGASWGHEYGGRTPRAWWFKGGRPAATTGWWKGASGSWYYFAGKPSAEASTWVYDGGQWYWMDYSGAMVSSELVDTGKGLYYLDSAGHPSGNGWMQIKGKWYYLHDGRAHNGWLYDGGSWYWLDGRAGDMATGWTSVQGSWYYMRSSGAMVTGWLDGGGTWYYLSASGAMVTGWLYDHGSWYYFGSEGMMALGWFSDGSAVYYAAPSGAMATGWLYSNGSWYYLSSSGARATGWVLDGGAWYYLSYDGRMVTGRNYIDGRFSVFTDSGVWVGYTF